MSTLSKLFLNTDRRLRNGWWCLVFFLILALFVVPAVIIGRQHGIDLSPLQQALLVAAASWICQLLRRKPFTELTGPINGRWLKELFLGVLAGSALMLAPALVLLVSGAVRWEVTHTGISALRSGLILFVGVARPGRKPYEQSRKSSSYITGRDSRPLDGKPNFRVSSHHPSFRTRIAWSHPRRLRSGRETPAISAPPSGGRAEATRGEPIA
jgi:hypothetical protein